MWDCWVDAERANLLLQRLSEVAGRCGSDCPVLELFLRELLEFPEVSGHTLVAQGGEEWVGMS